MSTNDDVSAEALARVLGTLVNLGQAGIDWGTVTQAVLAYRDEQHQRLLDAHDGLSPQPQPWQRESGARAEADNLVTEVNGALVASLVRLGRDWQHLLQSSAPALKVAADAWRAETDPSHATTLALVNQLVVFGQAVGDFMQDQGAQFRHDLLVLQARVLHPQSV